MDGIPKDNVMEDEAKNRASDAILVDKESSRGIWSFGRLVNVLASTSEQVIEAYLHDLDEFCTGLKKEMEAIYKVASQVVKDIPKSQEANMSVVQKSLKSVGQVINKFGNFV
ncbi:hypothetical protein SUGI_0674920 [Cryptomeria japonica]|nr:hypothetical protein SUGI_0674920 [Cryptomeria japonica]